MGSTGIPKQMKIKRSRIQRKWERKKKVPIVPAKECAGSGQVTIHYDEAICSRDNGRNKQREARKRSAFIQTTGDRNAMGLHLRFSSSLSSQTGLKRKLK